ncbi:MAG: hypothetical protein LC734_01175, partial [Acidobacteria bacterium]|nr:hypothetical protein [Acidobacteriota bacterium]
IDELTSGTLETQYLGIRLRTPNVASRFGLSIDEPEKFERLIKAIDELPSDFRLAIHFHMASSSIGIDAWWHLFESMLRWCRSIESLAKRSIELLDIGGGWFPDDLTGGDRFRDAVQKIPLYLPNVRRVITEPGKALAQPSMALATQILEIRRSGSKPSEVVIDGSIAELPMNFFYPHRILAREQGSWRPIGRGSTVLFGRLCMEHDVIAANVDLPASTREGDILIFCDAGAYDRSMSYAFGRG